MSRVRIYRNHGIVTGVDDMPGGLDFVLPGLNYRMTDFQAAMALGPLERFPEELARRKALAAIYLDALSSVPNLQLPEVPEGHSLQSFMVVLPPHIQRKDLIQLLLEDGIQTNLGAQALHCLSYYRHQYGWEPSDFSVAAKLYHHGLVLPLYGHLTSETVRWIAERVMAHVLLATG
jgi:perosamine synthetase